MKKTNFTFFISRLRSTFPLLLSLMLAGLLNGQSTDCTLVCGDQINVGIDNFNCEATLVAADLLKGEAETCPNGVWEVIILDEHDVVVPGTENGLITHDLVGMKLKYKVREVLPPGSQPNACWGYLVVEDKTPPALVCDIETEPFYCYDLVEFTPDVMEDCDDDLVPEMIGERVVTNDCRLYGPDTLMMIEQTWIVTDNAGNVSEPCTYTFFVERLDGFGENGGVIDFPPSYLKLQGNALACDENFPVDGRGNGYPSPTAPGGTGVPTYTTQSRTYDLYPDDNQFCNLLVDYEDRVISDNGCIKKIMRTWTVLEWSCGPRQRKEESVQMIEIVDTVGPALTIPADFTVTTSDYLCGAIIELTPDQIVVDDNCDNEKNVTLSYAGGFEGAFDVNGAVLELEIGPNVITFIAYDECGNSTEKSMTITVEDKTPPVVICDEFTVVSLTENGEAIVPATVFDDGSYDECKLDRIMVRRMTTTCDGYEQEDGDIASTSAIEDLWFDYIHFCCEDIGNDDLMVVMRVWDKAQNYNDCMVSVEVQDKLPPSIVCPPNITVYCGFDYANLDVFGTVQESADAIEPIVIPTEYLKGWDGNIGALTDGYADDNCVVSVEETRSDEDLNQCNIGYIYRTFTATDAGERSVSCNQTIKIEKENDFDLNSIDWPDDEEITGCFDPTSPDFHPDVLGYPQFNDDECALVGTTYEDHTFPFNNPNGDACFKILRKWKAIDWCQFEEVTRGQTSNFEYPTVTWTQVIKVNDPIDPIFTSSTARVTVCTYDPECKDGFVELNASATDNCTADLKASYRIDANNDGSFDFPAVTRIGNSISASGDYPIGSHRIEWTFEDRCGNVITRDQLFDVVNCKAPTPYVINGLAVDLMPMDNDGDGDVDGGMVELWASDFDAGSSHPCGYDVHLSFTPDTADRNMIFDCADFGMNTVRIYATVVTPNGTLIQDFAETSLDVQDNLDACDGVPMGGRAAVSGFIATEDNKLVEDVNVSLMGSELSDATTNASGKYAFPEMSTGGSYQVIPVKNDNPANGVSTLDLVMIQRHILGISRFDSPYKTIAADINKDGKVSASDLIEMRKLILGINDNFTNNTSWRFIDKGYGFFDVQSALQESFPEIYSINNLSEDMQVDFVGIKVGDVNANAVTNRLDRITTRSNQTLAIQAADKSFNTGDVVTVDVTMSELKSLIGLQAILAVDNARAEITGINGNGLELTDANVHFTAEGTVAISWNNPDGVSLKDGDVLFTLELTANASGNLSDVLTITGNERLSPEAYDNNAEVMNLDLEFNNVNGGEFQLLQNTPNPFNEVTQIGFVLPRDMNATLNVFDVTGKSLLTIRDNFYAGRNVINLSAHELNTTGVVYYTIQAGDFTATKKMVILR